ncbi:retrovirus-related pol polyprotein from transposon TNT 1-94 [Tanacetum coccineum]
MKTMCRRWLFKPVTKQSLPQKRNQAVRNTNVLKPGMYRIASTTTQTRTPQLPHASRNTNPYMSKSSGVIHTTSVSRPQLKCYQVKDKCSKPKRKANKSVATPHKKTVASDTTIQKSKSYYKELYENTNQEWKWWIAKRCPSGYTWTQKPLKTKKIWMPKIRKDDESTNLYNTLLFIVDSGCTKHMTGNLSVFVAVILWRNFWVLFVLEMISLLPILGCGRSEFKGNVTIKRVYYVEGLNHNLFSVGQFCDADLEVAFRKSTCFVRDLQGNNLLTGSHGSDLYTIFSSRKQLHQTQSVFIAKCFTNSGNGYGSRLLRTNKNKKAEHGAAASEVELQLGKNIKALRSDRGGEYLSQEFKEYMGKNGIVQHLTSPYTPQQNGVSERRNRNMQGAMDEENELMKVKKLDEVVPPPC